MKEPTERAAQTSGETAAEAIARFKERRLGLFVHFGLYSLAARGEWMRHGERTSDADYQLYFDHFDPDLFDPQAWAAQAEATGMQYVVVTTKHHEGFCLWDSELSDFTAVHTPYGRDLLGPLVDALRERGLERRPLPLPDRLASPAVPDRRAAPAAGRPRSAGRPARPRHRGLSGLPARAGP